MSNNAHELSNRLLNALDSNYNVVDMQAVNEIISILENFNITKELLETTRLGKHVNELRRQTKDATLARRAKVLVKRWRDLVIPPANVHPGSNRSSAERQVRRLGGTPLTSPALQRQVVSPVVPSPRSSSRPAWGYESDSQDVIVVVDDDPPEPSPLLSQTLKRPPSVEPIPVEDDKKAKRDKKPKKRRGHSRAGSGSDTPTAGAGAAWTGRNGTERRRNGCRRELIDPYAALVHKMPHPGAKKVKTTQELLEEIQSRGSKPAISPGNPDSPDVLLIEDPIPSVKVESPLRNGDSEVRQATPEPPPSPLPPLEDDRPVRECTCEEDIEDPECPAAWQPLVLPTHVHALHHTYLPGINGTRAPLYPHQFAVRKVVDQENPDSFNSVVPLYKYSDYADDQCVKNMSRVPLCPHLSIYQFAPEPPELPPPKTPPPLLPYPLVSLETPSEEIKEEEERLAVESIKGEIDSRSVSPTILTGVTDLEEVVGEFKCPKIGPETVSLPYFQPSVRLKAPQLFEEDHHIADVFVCPRTDVMPETIDIERLKAPVKEEVKDSVKCKIDSNIEMMEVEEEFKTEIEEHRTVERTKREFVDLDGRTLYDMCVSANDSIPYNYIQTSTAPVVTLPLDDDSEVVSEVLESALRGAEEGTLRDALGRPNRPSNFAEWHECAKLGDLIALPYVVID